MTFKHLALGSAMAMSFAALGAQATPVTVVNSSFESTVLLCGATCNSGGMGYQGDGGASPPGPNGGPFGPNYLVGWSGTGPSGAQTFQNNAYFAPSDGVNVAYLNGAPIYQDVGVLLANTTYTLTVAAGNQPNYGGGSSGTIYLLNGTDLSGTVLSSAALSSLPTGTMTDYTTTFTTGSSVSGDLTIEIALSGSQVLVDNVRLDAVPEPAAWALMLVGFGGLGAALRRRRSLVVASA